MIAQHLLAGIDDINNIIDSDAGLGDVSGENYLGTAGRSWHEHFMLVFPRYLRVQRQYCVLITAYKQ